MGEPPPMKDEELCRLVPDLKRGKGHYRIHISEELLAQGPAFVICALNREFQKLRSHTRGEKFLSREDELRSVKKRHLHDLKALLEFFRERLPEGNKTLTDFEAIVRECEEHDKRGTF